MSSIDDFIYGLSNSQNAPAVGVNDSEFDGNSDDLLLRFEQNAGINVSGGTTLTSIAPQNFINDLAAGKLTPVVLIWLAILGLFTYWVLKKS